MLKSKKKEIQQKKWMLELTEKQKLLMLNVISSYKSKGNLAGIKTSRTKCFKSIISSFEGCFVSGSYSRNAYRLKQRRFKTENEAREYINDHFGKLIVAEEKRIDSHNKEVKELIDYIVFNSKELDIIPVNKINKDNIRKLAISKKVIL